MKIKNIFLILLAGLVLRLALHPFGTLDLDHGTFVAWSNILAQGGLQNFYNGWSDYLPGYLYILFALGKVGTSVIPTEFLYKLPAILVDVATGYLIYRIVSGFDLGKKKEKIALLAASFYLFNPAIFANSTLWGQVDSFTSLFSLLAVYLASLNPVLSAISLALGTIVKPQAALAGIPILFIAYRNKWKIDRLIAYGVIGLFVFVLGFLPFTTLSNLISFTVERLGVTLSQYQYTSVNAFSFWGLGGFWQPDTGQSVIGWAITIGVSLSAAWKLRKQKNAEYLVLAVTLLSGFLFMTRMHERHMLPVLAPLIVAASIYPGLIFAYIILSFTYMANLYYAYVWIVQDFKEIFTSFQTKVFIVLNLISYATLLAAVGGKKLFLDKLPKSLNKINITTIKEKQIDLPDLVSKKNAIRLIAAILIFAGFARIFMLQSPDHEYFDEVYHAFTAKVLMNGDPKGWEWWNPNPEGFAYEWTHPPVAKLGMIVGMTIFGQNSFGYRIPAAILGTISVGLIYAIAYELFKKRDIAILSAAVFALDGMPLVMSRIGMNDTYFLVCILLSFYFYLKEKNLFSAIFLGMAAASKWSTMWFLPILAVTHFALKRKIKPSYIWFFILPSAIYLASYIPFFTSGHTWDQFIELQKQMWWYHTGLKAEHSYSSPWWSWPFMARPVWLFVERFGNTQISNIYIIGNPIISWMGLISAITCAYWAIVQRSKKLGLVVFGYIAFFVTWAASPRIMFLYHYLPSIPFMAILIGYTLRRNKWLIWPFLAISAVLFIYFYPHWTGLKIPVWLDNSYYWFPSWR